MAKYIDPQTGTKKSLLRTFGLNLMGALDDPLFNGSRANTLEQQSRTGYRSRNPITLAGQRPLRRVAGLRIGRLEVNAGLNASRLLRVLEKSDHAHLRALVPWQFSGAVAVGFSGRRLAIDIPWPEHLQQQTINLRALAAHPHDGSAAVLGACQNGELIALRLDNKMLSHALIGGMTGSGKSNTIALLASQFGKGPEAETVLIDGKNGQGLGPVNGLPNQCGPLATNARDIKCALAYAVRVMRERNAAYNQAKPPLYVFFDEFDEYTRNDKAIARMVYLLVKQGRTAAVHMFLLTQKPDSAMWGKETGCRANIPIRLGMRTTSYEASAAIFEHPKPRADHLLGAGDAHLVMPGKAERLQIAFIDAHAQAAAGGGEPAMRAWPKYDAGMLNHKGGDDDNTRARPFTVHESVVALHAARAGWGRAKTKNALKTALGYGMGSERIDERLLPHGDELLQLENKLNEL